MSDKFLIADTHFGHKNIIEYENRPFKTIEEMDETIIENWNAVVNKEDLIYHLGDVSFYGQDKTKKIIQRLNGRKILIMGNHDKARSMQWWREAGFAEAYNYPIIVSDFLIMSHEPVYLCNNMPYINIHGHLHSNKQVTYESTENKYFNVGVDCTAFYPTYFRKITDYLQRIYGSKIQED